VKKTGTVVIVGGGLGGSAAAINSAKLGSKVVLIEKSDRLLGAGNVAGEVYGNARYSISWEAYEMGGKELFDAINSELRHSSIKLPGVENTAVYDVFRLEGKTKGILQQMGVEIYFQKRVKDVLMEENRMAGVVLDDGQVVNGDTFVDATGTAGPVALCNKYGKGCAMCVYRCHVYGQRVSITAKAGINEGMGVKLNGQYGGISQGVSILKESLDKAIVRQIEKEGVLFIPVSPDFSPQFFDIPKADTKTVKENLVLIDNGLVKAKSRPIISLDKLNSLKGFENAVFYDPQGGSKANSMRFFSVAPRDNTLKVEGILNLFCAGEKQGLLVGVCEAVVSGLLAGYNAARMAKEEDVLEIPTNTALGETIAFTNRVLNSHEGYMSRYSCLSGKLFKNLEEKGLYCTNIEKIKEKVVKAGLKDIFNK